MASSFHNPRVLVPRDKEEIAAEMRRVGPEEQGISHMLPKAQHFLVKLEKVRRPVAHILKETFLSKGGDAVVNRGLIVAAVDESDVILCGTQKQYDQALSSLREQGFGCDKLAEQIETAIRNYISPQVAAAWHEDERVTAVLEAIGKRTLIMGILNVTPDSFSDGGRFIDPKAAVEHALQMVEDGADIIDIGGESTRPGSDPVPTEEEIKRVVPVIEVLARRTNAAISIDTYKSDVARAALDAGACIVNDISAGLFDPRMPALAAERKCPVVLMHIKGTPKDMQQNPSYEDLMGEICSYLYQRIRAFADAGLDERLLMIDPGFGFGKTVHHNLELLRRLRELKSIGRPIVVGTSRKSTIGKVLGDLPVEERLEGTAATVAIAVANGADIVRVHDVKEMARVARMTDAVVRPPAA
ncbi:MAG: dihydropteroate synthase [Armatimonadota bacterium]|nr:dihydropteroate synthase [Armatimonadota bacterium]